MATLDSVTFRVCKIEDCFNKHDSFGYCSKHAQRFRRTGNPLGSKPRKKTLGCYVADCGKRITKEGLCVTHNRYKERTGDPNIKPARKERKKMPSPKNKRSPYKYRHVTNHAILGTGTIAAHRLVMTEHLGRKLLTSEQVHHINGDTHDNRLENLELWDTSHPAGQRIEDKVKWATEILQRYKPERLANEL